MQQSQRRTASNLSALKHRSMLYRAAFGSALAAMLPTHALANPTGGTVTGGSATITAPDANTVNINQTSDRAIIDWNTFNINQGETTRFYQPGAGSIALNRIHDQNPSIILGNLVANGRIVLVNPNGVVFGLGSKVNVGSLIATTADIKNASFMAGSLNFDIASTNGAASIINKGSITAAQGGLVALIAPGVRNDGVIVARMGTVELGSAKTVAIDMYGDNLYSFALGAKTDLTPLDENGNKMDSAVSNTGTIKAHNIMLTANAARDVVTNVVNNTGVLEASSGHMDGGTLVLDGGSEGTVHVGGKLLAKGGKAGGNVTVTGQNIEVAGATIDASGQTAGGTVRIGGDFQGGGTLTQAESVSVDATSTIDVSSANGLGGSAVIWSTGLTDFNGAINAAGGNVETSGEDLNLTGSVTAANWLLDPRNLTITTLPNFDTTGTPNVNPTGILANVKASSITTALNNGTNVNITTGSSGSDAGNVSILTDLNWSGKGSLNIQAAHDINDSSSIVSSGPLGGSITLGAGHDLNIGNVLGDVDVKSAAGNINLTATNDINLNANGLGSARVTATAGDISLTAGNNVNVHAGSIGNDADIVATAGNVLINAKNLIVQSLAHAIGGDAYVTAGHNVTANVTNDTTIESGWLSAGNDVKVLGGGIFHSDLANSVYNTGSTGSIVINQNVEGSTAGSIQNAIDAVGNIGSGGATVQLGAGTWTELVNIGKSNLTLNGKGDTTVLDAPDSVPTAFTAYGNPISPVVYVHDADGVTVSNLKVDGLGKGNGNYRFVGIGYDNAGGAITNTTITNIEETPVNGDQHGVGIYATATNGTDRTLTVSGNTINNFQKNGMVIDGANLDATVDSNTVTGNGAIGYIAQNGIQFSNGATGSITNNTISGIGYTNPANAEAADILLFQAGDGVTVDGNKITGTGYDGGIYAYGSNGVKITNDTVTGALDGIIVDTATGATVSGNTIVGLPDVTTPSAGFATTGVTVYGSNGVLVDNNTIHDISGNGVYIEGTGAETALTADTISNNLVYNTGDAAISVSSSPFVTVKNNVVGFLDKLFTTAGAAGNIKGDGIYVASSDNASITGNHVTNTKSLGGNLGNGIALDSVTGGTVSGNSVSNLDWDGIHIANDTTTLVSNNTVDGAARVGIYGGSDTGLTIDSNHVKNANTTIDGYGQISTDFGSGIVISNNFINEAIAGNTRGDGVRIYDASGTNSITGNSIRNVSQDGIILDTTSAGITGNTISDAAQAGVYLLNSQATAFSGNTLNRGSEGLVVDGGSSTVAFTGANTFNAQSDQFIKLANGALGGTTKSIADQKFAFHDGDTATAASALTLPQDFALEDKIYHKMDNGALGLLTWVNNTLFATTSTGIQHAIDISDNGGTVDVAPGTYYEQLHINWNDFTLNGSGADQTIVSPTSLDGSSLPNGTPWGNQYYGSIVLVKDASNVTVSNLDIDGSSVTGEAPHAGLTYYNASGNVTNVDIKNGGTFGLYAVADSNYGHSARTLTATNVNSSGNSWAAAAVIGDDLTANLSGGDYNGTGGEEAIDLSNASHGSVTGASVETGNHTGVSFHGSHDFTLTDNTITGNGSASGIQDDSKTYNVAAANDITIKGGSITNVGSGILSNGGKDWKISGVTVTAANSGSGTGISLLDTTGTNSANGNTVSGFATGIDVVDSQGTTISGNTLTNNTTGISVDPSAVTQVTNDTVTGGTTGIIVSDTTAFVDNNTVHDVAGKGITLSYSGTGSHDASTVSNNLVYNTGANGIDVSNSPFVTIKNNVVGYTNKLATLLGLAENIHGDAIFVDSSNGTKITGNKVAQTRWSGLASDATADGSGIHLNNTTGATISGNKVTNSGWDGIKLNSDSNVTVSNDTVDGAARVGIYGGSVDGLLISGNHVENAGLYDYGAISTDFGSGITISGNFINDAAGASSNTDGIRIYDATGTNSVTLNKVKNVSQDGINIELTDGVNVLGNTVTGPAQSGIHLLNSDNALLALNTISDTSNGIWVDSSDGATITLFNVLSNNTTGIWLDGSNNANISLTEITNNTGGTKGISVDHSDDATISLVDINGGTMGVDVSNGSKTTNVNHSTMENLYVGINDVGGQGIDASHNTFDNTANGIFLNTVTGTVSLADNKFNLYSMQDGIHLVNTDHGSISGNTISGADHGIWLEDSDYATITGGKISNSTTGIYVDPSVHTTIDGVTISGGTTGVLVDGSDYTTVKYSTISGATTAIDAKHHSDHLTVDHDTISGAATAVKVSYSNDLLAKNNTITGIHTGVGTGYSLDHSDYSTIEGGTVKHVGTGINLDHSYKASVDGVTIHDAVTGIALNQSDRANLIGNTIYSVFKGIDLVHSDDATLKYDTIYGAFNDGVDAQHSNGLFAYQNLLIGNGTGIKLDGGHAALIENFLFANGTGVKIDGVDGTLIAGNIFGGNHTGIDAKDSEHLGVYLNSFYGDKTAVSFHDVDHSQVDGNFLLAGYTGKNGIVIKGGKDDSVDGNTILGYHNAINVDGSKYAEIDGNHVWFGDITVDHSKDANVDYNHLAFGDIDVSHSKGVHVNHNSLYKGDITVSRSDGAHVDDNFVKDGGITVKHSDHVKVDDNTVEGGHGTGIALIDVDGAQVKGNSVYGKTIGFLLSSVNDLFFSHNTADYDKTGLKAKNLTEATLKNNEFDHDHTGVKLIGSSDVTLSHNEFNHDHTGLYIDPSSDITVSHNTFKHDHIGLDIEDMSGVTVQNNIFAHDHIGAKVADSSDVDFNHNTFYKNGIGALVINDFASSGEITEELFTPFIVPSGSSQGITFENNHFTDNGIGAKVKDSSDVTFTDNHFFDNYIGAKVISSQDVDFDSNHFTDNHIGALVTNGASHTGGETPPEGGGDTTDGGEGDGPILLFKTLTISSGSPSTGITFENNHFVGNDIGAKIKDADQVAFSENLFKHNGVGVKLLRSDATTFSGDIFSGNHLGIKINDSQDVNIADATFKMHGGEDGILITNGSGGTIVQDSHFTGGHTAITLNGEGSDMQFADNGSTFDGQDFYFVLKNGAMFGQVLDASQQTFAGVRASDFTIGEYNDAEARTIDINDDATLGLVFYRNFPNSSFNTEALDEFQRDHRNLYRKGLFSYAGHTIVNNTEERNPTFAVNGVNLSLLNGPGVTQQNNTANIAGKFASLSPAAGGDHHGHPHSASDFANLSPAAGGDHQGQQFASLAPSAGSNGGTPSNNGGACGNSFLGDGFNNGFTCH